VHSRGRARLFISEKGCKARSRAAPFPYRRGGEKGLRPANSRPYYRHNNKVNALQIKRTRKTFRVVLCPFYYRCRSPPTSRNYRDNAPKRSRAAFNEISRILDYVSNCKTIYRRSDRRPGGQHFPESAERACPIPIFSGLHRLSR